MDASGPPKFINMTTTRGTRFIHLEMFSSLNGTTNFSLTEFDITPVNSNLFPWLSLQATGFDEYILHGVVFYFKPTFITGNLATGSVTMSTQYNPTSPPFTSIIEMVSNEFGVSGSGASPLVHGLECAKNQSSGYVFDMPGPVRAGAVVDLKNLQIGRFCVATQGQGFTTELGELYVTFDIEFLKPKLSYPVTVQSLPLTDTTLAKSSGCWWSAVGPVLDVGFMTSLQSSRTALNRWSFITSDPLATNGSSLTFNDVRLSGRSVQIVGIWVCTSMSVSATFSAGLNVSGLVNGALNSTNSGSARAVMNFNAGPGPWTINMPSFAWAGNAQTFLYVTLTA
jgi:hypothetical protein